MLRNISDTPSSYIQYWQVLWSFLIENDTATVSFIVDMMLLRFNYHWTIMVAVEDYIDTELEGASLHSWTGLWQWPVCHHKNKYYNHILELFDLGYVWEGRRECSLLWLWIKKENWILCSSALVWLNRKIVKASFMKLWVYNSRR